MTRRAFDVVVAAVVLVATAPLWFAIAVVIKVSSPGPVLHRGVRVGQHGRPFTLWKFRTMAAGAASSGPGLTGRDDPRVTPTGRLLRASKVDELPQLLNLLRGDMTLVGPRPEDPRYVRLYTPEQRGILKFKPGITSPASIIYRHEEHLMQRPPADLDRFYMERLLPAKIEIDQRYMERRTARSDLGVVIRTAMSLVRRDVPVEVEA